MSLLRGLALVASVVLLWAAGGNAQAGDHRRSGDVAHKATPPQSASQVGDLSDSVLGDQAYDREDLEAAIRHYRQARMADPNDVVIHDRLVEAERQYQAEARLNRLYTSHFIVAFPREISRRDANRVADRLELIARAIALQLSYLPAQPFSVVLYPRPQFHAATFTPPWTKAVFDGKIRLLVEDGPGLLSEEVLTHEYVHAIVHRLSAGNVPAWLSEGLALFFDGGTKFWHRTPGQAKHDYLPLTTRHADLTSLSAADARAAYRHSYEVSRALLAQYGLVRVRLLLERLSHTRDFSSAFEAVMGERFAEFQRQWMAEQDRKGF